MRHECKITVIDKKCFADYQEKYLADPKSGPCPFFNVGDEFLLKRTPRQDDFYHLMNGKFCGEAWDAVSRYVDPRFYGWAIECEGRMIGTIGAYDFDPEKNQIEVGFSIERVSWGKGYAAEALRAVLEYLTIQEGIAHVTAWCASDNVASSRTLEKAGMRFSGVDVGGLEVGGKRYDRLDYIYSDQESE